jgi:hypothetical protein
MILNTSQVQTEKISLDKGVCPDKIKCDTELRAFDAEGNEHRFTPEFHVSSVAFYMLNC